MFTKGWPAGDTADFINYVLNPDKGQKLVEEVGFVPLY
jgi:phosphate transport system substrate-binding protein